MAALAAVSALAAFAPRAAAEDLRTKQEIVFGEIAAHAVGDAPFDIAAKATSGLPVTLSVVAGPAVLDGKNLRLTGEPGLVIIRASQAGNAAFQAARDAERAFAVRPRPSAPSFRSQPAGANVGVGEPLLLAVEVAGEPEPALQWRRDGDPILGANAARLSVAMAGFADSGSYDVIASNASGEARSAPARVVVGKHRQTISFQGATIAVAGQPVQLSASASSGLPVEYQVVSGVAFLNGDMLTSQGGPVEVQATQRGNATFEAAPPVTQTFLFNPPPASQRSP